MKPPHPHKPQAVLSVVASRRDVHAAFQFFHLQEARFRQWHERLVVVPAPPFGEAERAAELLRIFSELGLADAATDMEGNAMACIYGRSHGSNPQAQAIAICAHLDTVFPAEMQIAIRHDAERIFAPGASDNGAGLAAMLAIAAAMQSAGIQPACDFLFVGTVGEEGDGNLRGMRALFQSAVGQRIGTAIAIDGAGSNAAVIHGLGSKRFQIEITGPGGHSWSDSDRPNPIVALAQAIVNFQQLALPADPATSVNFGTISGGTSVNAIPQSVACRVDVRSVSQEEILRQEVRLHRAVEDAVLRCNAAVAGAARPDTLEPLRYKIETVGERPAGTSPAHSALAENLRVVDRLLQITTRWRTASTDANIPLALGVPAVALGGGGTGGGAHTADEWFDPAGRELALRRILLLLLTTVESLADAATEKQ